MEKKETYVSTISSCCNNKRFSAFGYRWVFSIEDIPKLRNKTPIIAWNKGLKINNKKSKKVKQYNMNNEFIKEFNSVKEAEELQRKKRGSNNQKKAYKKVALQHERIKK